jgi:capsid assembly protease
MKLTELLSSPWAILPDSLREIQEIYATHLKGDKIDIAAVEARIGRPLSNDQQAYQVREGGVAVLTVDGVIAPKANLFTQVSGGASAQMLVRQVESAAADSRVKALVMSVDSPGGSVFGIPEWGAAVRAVSAIKPVVSVSDGTLASAAYWGASAANAVYLSGSTVHAGSIGIYARMGLSQQDPSAVEFVRGKYKRSAINGEAPSAEYVAHFEGRLDHLYSVFVDTVAEQRGVSSDAVLERMADGRVFIGQQAIDAGLADGFATVDAIVEQLATNPAKFAARRKAVFALGGVAVSGSAEETEGGVPPSAGVQIGGFENEPVPLAHSETQPKGVPMDRKTLEEQHPVLFAQLKNEFTAEGETAGKTAGAAAELQRIQDVRAQGLPGHEALIETLAMDGKTTGAEAAAAVVAAERAQRASAAAAFDNDAPPAVDTSAAPANVPLDAAQQAAQAKAYAKEHGVGFVAAMKALNFA